MAVGKAGFPGFLFFSDDICGLLLDFPGFKLKGEPRMVKIFREEGRSSALRGGKWERYLGKGERREESKICWMFIVCQNLCMLFNP